MLFTCQASSQFGSCALSALVTPKEAADVLVLRGEEGIGELFAFSQGACDARQPASKASGALPRRELLTLDNLVAVDIGDVVLHLSIG